MHTLQGVDLVTEADTHVEKIITQMIKVSFPNDIIIGEEDQADRPKGKQGDPFPTDRIWCGKNLVFLYDLELIVLYTVSFAHMICINLLQTQTHLLMHTVILLYHPPPVDPIDGTTNFVHNYPFVAVSIGFMNNAIPRVGVVYNPFTNSLYEAAQGSGQGTLLNDKPVQIDNVATSITDCLLVNNIGHYRYDDFVDESTERVKKWLRAGLRGYRASGSAAQNLAHVASGQVSCYYEHGYGGPWDVCAGMVLVREAGGVVYDAREVSSGGGKDLQMTFGKGSVCAGGKKVVEDVLRVAGKPTFTFSK